MIGRIFLVFELHWHMQIVEQPCSWSTRENRNIRHGAIGKEELSDLEHYEGKNYPAWSTMEVKTIMHGALRR